MRLVRFEPEPGGSVIPFTIPLGLFGSIFKIVRVVKFTLLRVSVKLVDDTPFLRLGILLIAAFFSNGTYFVSLNVHRSFSDKELLERGDSCN